MVARQSSIAPGRRAVLTPLASRTKVLWLEEDAKKWLQPLLLKIHLKWGVEVVSKRGWKFEAREAAQRLLSWTAEV